MGYSRFKQKNIRPFPFRGQRARRRRLQPLCSILLSTAENPTRMRCLGKIYRRVLIFRNGLFENGVVISSLVSGIHPSPASCTQEITHLLERAGGPIARATKYRILSADGSSWSEIIPLLEADGFKVIAVQNPLTSLQDDVSAVKRALDRAGGPVILVGHSWGRVVITAAGVDERVKGLVYVAALAPDAGETGAQLSAKFDPAPIFKHIAVVDGYIWLNRDAIPHFAGDLSKSQQDLIYATQGPANAALFEAKVDVPAWKNKPSWYVVALEDGTINTEQERFMAKRMGATTIEVDSSHVPPGRRRRHHQAGE